MHQALINQLNHLKDIMQVANNILTPGTTQTQRDLLTHQLEEVFTLVKFQHYNTGRIQAILLNRDLIKLGYPYTEVISHLQGFIIKINQYKASLY